MSDIDKKQINNFLVSVFHQILNEEQKALANLEIKSVTVREIHLMDQIPALKYENIEATVGNIAQKVGVTEGSASVMIKKLVGKKYLARRQDKSDKRKYHLELTKKAQNVLQSHKEWHDNFTEAALENLSDDEKQILNKTLNNIANFIKGE